MKKFFSCSLTGYHWWKPFLGLVFLSLIVKQVLQDSMDNVDNFLDPSIVISAFLFVLVLSVILILIEAFFYMILYRIAFSHITFQGKTFSFTGKAGEYVSLVLVCSLLLIVTLGFYLPWFMTRITRYIASHIHYDDTPLQFEGKPRTLLKYFVLAFILPLVVWGFLFGFVYVISSVSGYIRTEEHVNALTYLMTGVLFLFILPFIYYLYKWTVNFTWRNFRVLWNTEFWSSLFFIFGQTCLLIITVGIYFPGFLLSIIQFFAARTVLEKDGQPAGRFGFRREAGGFVFIWKQILLSVISFGIYLPWAYANTLSYMIDRIFVDNTPVELPQNY